MYFKRIEMHGFKSFAEPVVIEFHEGVTCIVGPNGSGKSNISDAIRWVLGEQSPKTLRGGKMEEVIFAGTDSRKPRGMAEVTLVIDNSTGILPIDYNEVAITRRMYRSGESEYLINNNQCRLRDIRELIMDTGIGVDGYSIIGQGKIADIVSDKPESRREIFEEAAGVVLYKSKKAESERKLSSANINLDRVNDIISEIEGRIDGLRDDSVKAKEYLELKDRFRELEINITLKNIDSLNKRNAEITTDVQELAANAAKITTDKKSLDENLEKEKERNDNLERLGNDARDKLLAKVEELNRLTNQSQLNTERLSTIDKDTNRINEEATVLNEKLEKEQKNKAELEISSKEIVESQKTAEAELTDKVGVYNEITKKVADLAETIDAGKDSLFALHNQASSKRSEAKSIDGYKETLQKRKEQIKADSEEASKSKGDMAALIEGTKKEYQLAKANADKLTEAIKTKTSEKISLEANRKELTVKSEDLRIQAGQLTSRMKTIQEMENNYEGYNGAVKYIMKSGLKGIEGVVAELINVPSGFEVAVETALGGALQNIICDRDENAKAAINSLKSNKAGRLTFLPVASIKGNRANVDSKISSNSGFKGLAVDCVEFDTKYKNVFEYLLGRVAIVDTMDSAISLSKMAGSGIRFVTLDGEIINASGAITGGKYKNASANLLERKGEIAKLEETIEGLRAEYKKNTEKLSKLESDLEKCNEEITTKTAELSSMQLNVMALNTKIESLESSLQDLESSNNRFANELSNIEKDQRSADEMIAKLNKEAEETDEKIKETNARIASDMEEYEAVKAQMDGASEAITATRIKKSEWDNKLEGINNLVSRIDETIADYEFQIEIKTKELEELEKEKNSILFGSDDTEGNTAILLEEKKSLEEYIAEVTAERTALSEKINGASREQQEMGEKVNALLDQKYQLEIRLAKNETQLDTHKERLWEDFEISYAQAVDLRDPNFVMSTSVKESREIKNRMRELGEVNVGAIKEYDSVSERYKFLTEQRKDIESAMEELQTIIADMDRTITTKFKENFDQVVVNFEEVYKEIFKGGHAELRLEDETRPLESGIVIEAQPPGKELKNINLLSGGEKTMTAISLMFAVLKTKPTPFCILDEVEAALDDPNIDTFARYLRKFDDIQFTLITHQKATMEHADVLYGITMAEKGVSKVLSLRLGDNFEI